MTWRAGRRVDGIVHSPAKKALRGQDWISQRRCGVWLVVNVRTIHERVRVWDNGSRRRGERVDLDIRGRIGVSDTIGHSGKRRCASANRPEKPQPRLQVSRRCV